MSTLYEQIVELLREHARAGLLPTHIAAMPLTPDTKLSELGIDSLGKMSLLSSLMELTDKYFADDSIRDDDTLADIAKRVS